MPIAPSVPRDYPIDYPAPKKYVLVLSCVDYRLLDDLVRFLDHDNLGNRYYHVTFAGAALGLTGHVYGDLEPSQPPPAAFDLWRQTFIDHFRATVALTEGKLTDVYIVQHEDCGAFKLFVKGFKDLPADRQAEVNREYADALLTDIRARFCDTYNAPVVRDRPEVVQEHPPAVHTFFMDLRGNVRRFNSYVPSAGERCPTYYCPCPKLPPVEGPTEEPGADPEGKPQKARKRDR